MRTGTADLPLHGGRAPRWLFERMVQLGSSDAVLAASARNAGASAVLSADGAYASVPQLPHIVPDAAGVAKLLRQVTPR